MPVVLTIIAAVILAVIAVYGFIGVPVTMRIGAQTPVMGTIVGVGPIDADRVSFGNGTDPVGVGNVVRISPWCVLHITSIGPADDTGDGPPKPGGSRDVAAQARLW